MRLPHVTWLITYVCAACNPDSGARPLLSATRLALTENDTVTVHVDVGSTNDFTVTPPANVTVTPSSDGDGPLVSVTPSCDAVVAQNADMLAVEVQETTGARRRETLELAVTNNKTKDCFRHVEIVAPDLSPLACADLDGTGLSLVTTYQRTAVDLENQTQGTTGFLTAPGFSELLAVRVGAGMTIYAIDESSCAAAPCAPNLWQLEPNIPNGWAPTAAYVGVDMTPFRSAAATSDGAPDYVVGWNFDSQTFIFNRVDLTSVIKAPNPSPATTFPILGLGTWGFVPGAGDKLFVIGLPLQGGTAFIPEENTFKVSWNGSGSVQVSSLAQKALSPSVLPVGVIDAMDNVVANTTIATRSGGPNGDDLVAGIEVGAFDGSIIDSASDLSTVRAYGGIRSVAPTQDGRVLLGADSGALLSYYDEHGQLRYDAIDPAHDSTAFDEGYGDHIAPCLDHSGNFVGYAVTTSSPTSPGIRVARLPGY